MRNFYEKTEWTRDAQDYDKSAGQFSTIVAILGIIGLVIATILLLISLFALGEGGLAGVIGAVTLGLQSFILLVFGSMMRGLSKVLLAVFEMTVSENRLHIYNADPNKDEEQK